MKLPKNKMFPIKYLIVIIAITLFTSCTSPQPTETQVEVDMSVYENLVSLSTLQYPATNSVFRYNVYTHYVTISELLATDSSITIPDTIDGLPVISIEPYAFYNKSTLKNVYMGANIQVVGYSSFEDCINLESITLPSKLKEIGESAFSGCSNLKSVVIPQNILTVSRYAFSYCTSLTSVIIEESNYSEEIYSAYERMVQNPDTFDEEIPNARFIDSNAFAGCSSLKHVWIPKDIISIDDSAFKDTAEDISIYGYKASEAANFSSVNLIDYIIMNKSSFKSIASTAINSVPQYPSIGTPLRSSTWEVVMDEVKYYDKIGQLMTEMPQKIAVVHLTVKNIGNASAFFNGLDVICRADGYTQPQLFDTATNMKDNYLAGYVAPSQQISGYIALPINESFRYLTLDFTYLKNFDSGTPILAIFH